MSIKRWLHHLNLRSTRILSKNFGYFIVFILFTGLFICAKINLADDPTPTPTSSDPTPTPINIIKQIEDAQVKGNNAESWSLHSWNTTVVNALTSLTGPLEFDDQGKLKNQSYGGILGGANNLVATLYVPPASGIQYLAQLKDNFLSRPTYAQGGVGFKGLQPLLPLWTGFRNVVYVLFSLVFVITGLMIVLRIKISPQAVITIQTAIPRLISSLILVTFSYAIAGLMIDFSYLVQGLGLSILFHSLGVSPSSNLLGSAGGGFWVTSPLYNLANPYNFNNLNNANFSSLSLIAQGAIPTASVFALSSAAGQIIIGVVVSGITGALGTGAGFFGWLVGGVIGAIVGLIGGIIMVVVILILVAIWLIKLWFGLLKAYLNILLKIITAPFEIAMGAFPNSKIGFSSWLIGLLAQIAVFPVVLLATILIAYLAQALSSCNVWYPNLLNPTVDLVGLVACDGAMIGAAVGLAGLALLAKLPGLVPEAIFQLKPSPFGKAIGEGLANNALIGTMRGGVSQGVQLGIAQQIYSPESRLRTFFGRRSDESGGQKAEEKHQNIPYQPAAPSNNKGKGKPKPNLNKKISRPVG